jgi:tetratricopeptide (TPR) repeat protein
MERYNLVVIRSPKSTGRRVTSTCGSIGRRAHADGCRRSSPGSDVEHSERGEAMARYRGCAKRSSRCYRTVVGGCVWVSTLLLLFSPTVALAQSPLVAELNTVAVSYHHDPTRLDAIREGLEQTLKTDSRVENLVALARVNFIWGDIRATTADQKLAAYDRGRQVAKRVIELDPRSVEARFWYALNTARWGQTKGVLRSLFLLPTVQEEIQLILKLAPQFTPVYALAGHVFYEVPGFLGGDLQKAEEMFRKGLEQDPQFTAMRVGLGKTLLKLGRVAEAQRELQAVLDETAPSNPADWQLRDIREARELLASVQGKS